MLPSNLQHNKNCSYYTKIQPISYAVKQLIDVKCNEMGLLQAAIFNIYKFVIHHAEDGNGFTVLPPSLTYITQRRKNNLFLFCEFSNVVNNTLFLVWLTKVETVNVST
jgi:hypothetical protein